MRHFVSLVCLLSTLTAAGVAAAQSDVPAPIVLPAAPPGPTPVSVNQALFMSVQEDLRAFSPPFVVAPPPRRASDRVAELSLGIGSGEVGLPEGFSDEMVALDLQATALWRVSPHLQLGVEGRSAAWANEDTEEGSASLHLVGGVARLTGAGGIQPYVQAGLGLAYSRLPEKFGVMGESPGSGPGGLILDRTGFGYTYELVVGLSAPVGDRGSRLSLDLGLHGASVYHRMLIQHADGASTESEQAIDLAVFALRLGVVLPM